MKRALVLAGGGSKGAYESGFIKALNELGIDFDIVTGTSIGALNGCLLVQRDYQKLFDLWDHLDITQVLEGDFDKDFNFDLDTMLNQSNLVISFFKNFIKEKGVDITPLKTLIRGLLNEEQFLSSSIDFGLCTVHYPSLKPVLITKKEMGKELIYDYLIASASCFPVFPIYNFNNQSYIDGGYYDNVPIDLALEMGADEVIVVDMKEDATHKHYLNRPNIDYTTPYMNLGAFMDFSRESLDRNQRIGYQTAMKHFHRYDGVKYTFKVFESPIFHEFYKDVLYMERYIRYILKNDNAGNINEKFLASHKNQPLNEKDYLFVCMDWLGDLMNRDPSYVYDFEIFTKDLLIDFQKYIDKDYQIISLKSPDELLNSFQNMNRKGVVGRMLHALIYPEEEKIDMQRFLPIFSKEVLMARLLYLLYKKG